jgi:hypothetical protein
MRQNRKRGLAALLAGGLVALAAGAVVAAPSPVPRLIVHEWGTFLSVQGSDGATLGGMVDSEEDLPNFVRERGLNGLPRFVLNQKMETPVTYFYVDRPMSVEVRVDMPHGLLTHWFPAVRSFGPPKTDRPRSKPAGSFLDWGKIDLFPDVPARGQVSRARPAIPAMRPVADTSTWRFVRQTGAALVHIPNPAVKVDGLAVSTNRGRMVLGVPARQTDTALVLRDARDNEFAVPLADIDEQVPIKIERRNWRLRPEGETEKFLFYRGLGAFELPLEVRSESGKCAPRLTFRNRGAETLAGLFLVEVRGDAIRFAPLPDLKGKAVRAGGFGVDPAERQALARGVPRAKKAVADALVGAGLYRKEAEAMVNNWEHSYFRTEGLRVLYLLPRSLTDKTIPLRIRPSPRELVRVMVGRIELLTPTTEAEVKGIAAELAATDPKVRMAAEARLARFGRLREPVLRRAAALTKDPRVRARADALLAAMR